MILQSDKEAGRENNVDFYAKESKHLLGICCGLKDGSVYWCVSSIFNGLYRMDLITGMIEFVVELPENNLPGRQMYSDILQYKDSLYIIPMFAKKLVIFNKKKLEIKEILLVSDPKSQNKIKEEEYKDWIIGGGIIYKKWLVLYPGIIEDIYRINLETEILERNNIWRNQLESYTNINRNGYMMGISSHCLKEGCLYVPLAFADVVVKIDIEIFETSCFYLENENTGFSAIVYEGDSFWLAPMERGAFVKWKEESGDIKRLTQYPSNFKKEKYDLCVEMVAHNEKVYVFPNYSNTFLVIDTKRLILMEENLGFDLEKWNRQSWYMESPLFVRNVKIYENELYIVSGLLNSLIIYNLKEKNSKRYIPILASKQYEKAVWLTQYFIGDKLFIWLNTLYEQYYFDLYDLIHYVLQNRKYDYQLNNHNVGKDIYNHCIKNL